MAGRRGYKYCPCGQEVAGPRTKICPACGAEFQKKERVVVPAKTEHLNPKDAGLDVSVISQTVYKPAVKLRYPEGFDTSDIREESDRPEGPSPIKLSHYADGGFPLYDIIPWAKKVRAYFCEHGCWVTNKGLRHFARQELNGDYGYSFSGKEMTHAMDVISLLPDVQ